MFKKSLFYFHDSFPLTNNIFMNHSSVVAYCFQCKENGPELLANGAVNPTQRTVYYMHSRWKAKHFGSVVDPLTKLTEKVPHYRNLGA